jgi:hypothetical protein
MNRLSAERRAKVISALVEGNSIFATCRITGTAKGTVTRLQTNLGKACAALPGSDAPGPRRSAGPVLRDLVLLLCQEKNVPLKFKGECRYGDVWT